MSFISIVIPVYNAQEFLETCLESIVCQTFGDWQVVLVDDGSTDRSGAICQAYAERDARFRVIHQANAGTSAARNAGVEAADGQYVTFMDNDDWWRAPDCLERVAASLERRPVDLLWHYSCRANVVAGAVAEVVDTRPTHLAGRVAALPVEAGIRLIINSGLTTSAVWTKVVRRGLLAEHGIVFPQGMRNEDTQWSAQVIAHCQSVAWFDERFYVYRMGHDYAQTSHALSVSSVDDLESVLRRNLDLARCLRRERAAALRAFLAYPFIVWVGQASALGLLAPGGRREGLLSQLGPLSRSSRAPAVLPVRLACRLLGVRATARLLGAAYRRRNPGRGRGAQGDRDEAAARPDTLPA